MSDDVEAFTFTINRSELIPGGHGARIGFSDEFPDRQFLIVPDFNGLDEFAADTSWNPEDSE